MEKHTGKASLVFEGVQPGLFGEAPIISERSPLGTPPNSDGSNVTVPGGEAAGLGRAAGIAERRSSTGPVRAIIDEMGAGVGVG